MIIQITYLGFRVEVSLERRRAKVVSPLPAEFSERLESTLETLAELNLNGYYPTDGDYAREWAVLLGAVVLTPDTNEPTTVDNPNILF